MRSFTIMSLLETFLTASPASQGETFLTASPASQGATILFLAMLIYWQKR
ncbi:MAG: hypothetical protein E7D62_26400 [Klebsiella sp.]|nr:hypothetical protein [Klebsiella sp.]